jgi:hypothetical protein
MPDAAGYLARVRRGRDLRARPPATHSPRLHIRLPIGDELWDHCPRGDRTSSDRPNARGLPILHARARGWAVSGESGRARSFLSVDEPATWRASRRGRAGGDAERPSASHLGEKPVFRSRRKNPPGLTTTSSRWWAELRFGGKTAQPAANGSLGRLIPVCRPPTMSRSRGKGIAPHSHGRRPAARRLNPGPGSQKSSWPLSSTAPPVGVVCPNVWGVGGPGASA